MNPEDLEQVPRADITLKFINKACNTGTVPALWSTLNIVSISKSGDLSKTDKYLGISQSTLFTKTCNRILLNRLRPALDPLLRTTQNGSLQKCMIVQQIVH